VNCTQPPPETTANSAPDKAWARAIYERKIARLDRLADIAMEMAEDLGRQVKQASDTKDAEAAAMAFGRVSRAVRLTLMLQAKAVEAILDLDNPPPRKATAPEPEPIILERRFYKPSPNGPIEVDREGREIGERERLDRDDIHAALRTRPMGELIDEIRADLGLEDRPSAGFVTFAPQEPFSLAEGRRAGLRVNPPALTQIPLKASSIPP
jgi:hypothetical protein